MSLPPRRPVPGRRRAFTSIPGRSPLSRSPLARCALAALGVAAACGGATDSTGPVTAGGSGQVVVTTSLPALDAAADGHYEAWISDRSGRYYSIGRFTAGGTITAAAPVADPAGVQVTLEAPTDADAIPSEQVLLRGTVRDGGAELRYEGAITQSELPMVAAPGQFTMFSPSDNDSLGYPSNEQSGVWLFNMAPAQTAQRDYYVRVAQLQRGWSYEGWMVRDIGTAAAIWLSYGKFLPDWTGALNQPDDTGWGPFSGVRDFRVARLEDFPGDDWIANPLRLPWRAELPLPLDLREKDAQGRMRWSHVITIEPATDVGEPITTERPFVLRPYVDPFGDLAPGVARTITLHAESLPHGTMTLR